MKWFETQGLVNAEDNYVVARTDEFADYIKRVKRGRYVVLFAPRQTGKTTFFKAALEPARADTHGGYGDSEGPDDYRGALRHRAYRAT